MATMQVCCECSFLGNKFLTDGKNINGLMISLVPNTVKYEAANSNSVIFIIQLCKFKTKTTFGPQ